MAQLIGNMLRLNYRETLEVLDKAPHSSRTLLSVVVEMESLLFFSYRLRYVTLNRSETSTEVGKIRTVKSPIWVLPDIKYACEGTTLRFSYFAIINLHEGLPALNCEFLSF